MLSTITATLTLAALALASPQATGGPAPQASGAPGGGSVHFTPHPFYTSQPAILGCLIDINRVAYFPGGGYDCNNLCLRVTIGTKSLNLLNIGMSTGAHDMSVDAFKELVGSTETQSGGADGSYTTVDNSECQSLIKTTNGKWPVSNLNPSGCLTAAGDNFLKSHYEAYNFGDDNCKSGTMDTCPTCKDSVSWNGCATTCAQGKTPTNQYAISNVQMDGSLQKVARREIEYSA